MFVTRASFDRVVKSLETERERYDRMVEYNRELVRQIVEMRRENFVATPQAAPRQPDPVREAIALASNGDRGLWKHLSTEAARMRKAGTPEAEIADAMLNWNTDDDGIPSAADMTTAG